MLESFLITIGVIGFGLALLFLWGRSKDRRQAERDIWELGRSIELYHRTYGKYPIIDSLADEQYAGGVLDVLGGKKLMEGIPCSEEVAKMNPKLINFAKFFLGRRTIQNMIADPWGQEYHIAFDTDGDGITVIGRSLAGEETVRQIEAPFVIWSDGPNRINELGDGDDIASWRGILN